MFAVEKQSAGQRQAFSIARSGVRFGDYRDYRFRRGG
jgi:hypothetical protein